MFDYDGFIAKSKLYFQRAAETKDMDERALWQLLAFEFAIRAPLAKTSPMLLANHDGDGLLYAAGLPVPVQRVTSITSTLVLGRIEKVIPNFGSDRAKGAQRVLSVRNAELHSSDPAAASADRQEWLPPLLDALEAICAHLDLPITDLLSQELLDEATQYRETARSEVRGQVNKKAQKAVDFLQGLSGQEIAQRLATVSITGNAGDCPACKNKSLERSFGPARAEKSHFDEDSGEIVSEWTQVLTSAKCAVCGLTLESTAEAIAAGVDRTHEFSTSENRYDGWEDVIPLSEIEELLVDANYDGPEYMDE